MKIASWRLATLAAPVLLIGGVFAACGGGGDEAPATAPATKAGAATTAPTNNDIPAGAPQIDQDALAFKPDKLTVKAGEKVYFKNSETALHTVTIDGKNVSGNMKKGDVVVWTAPAAKTYKMTCDYHPQMNATITVQ